MIFLSFSQSQIFNNKNNHKEGSVMMLLVLSMLYSIITTIHSSDAFLQPSTIPNVASLTLATYTTFVSKGVRHTSHRALNNIPVAKTESISDYAEYSIKDSFNLIVLGDLHLEDDMTFHHQARADCTLALQKLSLLPCPPSLSSSSSQNDPINSNDKIIDLTADEMIHKLKKVQAEKLSENQLEMLLQHKRQGPFINTHLVSLGDLGRKDIRHEPGDAGTTKSFNDAKEFLDGFGVSYDLVTGNHDLEGLDEFKTDEDNLNAWMRCFEKDTSYFSRGIGDKTLLVGLSTVRFRDSPHSSHECHVDDEQLAWFQSIVQTHSHEDGWRILVFSHAPIMGSKLRVLQNVHVTNGCAWMNHCSENSRKSFINIVKNNPQIKLWGSGHFHLSHDFEDSLSRVNECTFVQVGVVGPRSTRDHTRQTRIVRGNSDKIEIYTINHHKRDDNDNAMLRLDAVMNLSTGEIESMHNCKNYDHANWFSAHVPEKNDGCYLAAPDGKVDHGAARVCWWHMTDGRVLGVHEGQIVEYDEETLSPLGIVVTKKELNDREVLIVNESSTLVLVDPKTEDMEVIHPNEDGSYWRKYQRNKQIRLEEKAREQAAKLWMERKNAEVDANCSKDKH